MSQSFSRKTATFVLIEDYFIYRLTGKLVSEGSLLCSTVYWDITTKQWWKEMLAFLQISQSQLPEIREPGEPIGSLLPEVARETRAAAKTQSFVRERWIRRPVPLAWAIFPRGSFRKTSGQRSQFALQSGNLPFMRAESCPSIISASPTCI